MHASRILCGARRTALTTKSGHNYYKGTRTGSMGQHTKWGGFRVDWDKLTPFVSRKIVPTRGARSAGVTYLSGKEYLENWKLDNSDEQR